MALPPYLRPTAQGCTIAVRAHAGARRDRLSGFLGEALKLEVRAAPEHGAANRAIEVLLARLLGVPRGTVAVVAGQASRSKVVAIDGLTPETVGERLLAILRESASDAR
jgi:uncharacterized protein